MTRIVKIRKGLDIPVAGKASDRLVKIRPETIAISPDDFPGYKWKPVVKPGDSVVIGTPVFKAKEADDIALVSPVTGTVGQLRRGTRRHIIDMQVIPDGQADRCVNIELPAMLPEKADEEYRARVRAILKNSGLWALMRQRPFDIVPEAEAVPRDIFVTAFDSAPNAPDIAAGLDKSDIYKGIEIMARLTDGKVYIGCRPDQASDLQIIANQQAVVTAFEGPHPAGNTGTQIAAISPVCKGDTVWTLDIRTLAAIGFLFNTNSLDFKTVIAVTGPEVDDPLLVETIAGADIRSILTAVRLKEGHDRRVISGNVLTGIKVSDTDGYLHAPYRQVSVIEEGDEVVEFMGWASLSPSKFSVKRMFPSAIFGRRRPYDFDSRLKGGRRAMILTGELDSVFPFDIYPEYLLKAIMASDYDRMEKLGIYEVAPEDFALPEFVDTSKEELQKIVREGLDRLRSEL